MKCPECGEEIPAGVKICPNCDYELTAEELAAAGGVAPAPEKPSVPERPAAPSKPSASRPAKPAAEGVAMPESILSHGDVSVSSHQQDDHSTHHTTNNTQNTQNNIANNTTNNTQQTIIINVGAGGQLPDGIVDEGTTHAVNSAAQHKARQQRAQQAALQEDAPQEESHKGVGSITGTETIHIDTRSNKRLMPVLIGVVAVVLVVGIWFFMRTDKPATQQEEQPVATQPAPQPATGNSGKSASTKTSTASKPAAAKPVNHYDEGMKAFGAGNYALAVEELTTAANAGNGDAAYQLGEMYENGIGVAANTETAISWYQKAASKGNKKAKRKLM